ncbi:MAG: ABC transporter permease [Chloroflexota bacterium]|nr:ABC transporter permease [Chloroflexota bacterium]
MAIFARQLWRNKFAMGALAVLLLLALLAILAPVLAPYRYDTQEFGARLQPPSAAHPFGTDHAGRDILSRIMYGGRVSLAVGFIAVGVAMAIGVPIGAVAGYLGGKTDLLLMWLMDLLISFPSLLLTIAIASALGPSIQNAMLAIGIVNVPNFARLVRSQVLSVRGLDYVEAARANGATTPRIIVRHVVPNTVAVVIVRATIGIAAAILTEAGLSFIGLGAQPPFPSWGGMLNDGRDFMRKAPYITTIPGVFIAVTVLAFNLLGDGLRDALDPRMKS